MMSNHKSSQANVSKQDGFSLAEMFMIITLLTVVSMPAIMSMMTQERELKRTDAKTTGSMAIDKIFDAVNPNITSQVNQEKFKIGCSENNPGTWTCETKASVFCDPLSRYSDSAKCEQGPYFFRRYQLGRTDNKLVVEVGVGSQIGLTENSPGVSVYRREYTMNSYRIYNAQDMNIEGSRADYLGRLWYPETPFSDDQNPLASVELTGSCSNGDRGTQNPINYRFINRVSQRCSANYRFRVTPGMNYQAKLYLVNTENPNTCSPLSDERTQHILNIQAAVNSANGPIVIAEKRNIDIGTKVDEVAGATTSEQLTFRIPAGFRDLVITPSTSNSCTGAYAEISGIELNQL